MNSSMVHDNISEGFPYDDITYRKTPYENLQVYGLSKLANILFAKEFGRRFQEEGISTYSVHPGVVWQTGIGADWQRSILGRFKTITDIIGSFGSNVNEKSCIYLRCF